MDIANKNIIRFCLILLGVMVAVLIGFSSNALPTNSETEMVLKDVLSIHMVSDVVVSMVVKANSFISYLFN